MNRRDFHKASGTLLLSFLVGGSLISLTPAEAKSRGVALQSLTRKEADLLALLGEGIVPGSKKSGLTHYVDHQLAASKAESLLIIKYLGVPSPYVDFYKQSIKAFQKSCPLLQKADLNSIKPSQLEDYISTMSKKNPAGWTDAPPAPFFYFVLRSDAIDVTYGTMDGFKSLDIPYMAHIEPDGRGWQ